VAALVSAVMNLRFLLTGGNLLTSWATVSFSKRTVTSVDNDVTVGLLTQDKGVRWVRCSRGGPSVHHPISTWRVVLFLHTPCRLLPLTSGWPPRRRASAAPPATTRDYQVNCVFWQHCEECSEYQLPSHRTLKHC
jgi:hypothetical protein